MRRKKKKKQNSKILNVNSRRKNGGAGRGLKGRNYFWSLIKDKEIKHKENKLSFNVFSF